MCPEPAIKVLRSVKRKQYVEPRTRDRGVSWTPNTDVYSTDEGLVIKVELAGVQRENLELTIDGRCMRIAGTRPDGCRAPQCKFMVMEINYGFFESVVEVTEGYDLSRAVAAYQNGFLRVDVPFFDPSDLKQEGA